jgi:hypothetical protein
MKIRAVEAELLIAVGWRRTGRQTDLKKLIIAF